jgi:hypothetical protein
MLKTITFVVEDLEGKSCHFPAPSLAEMLNDVALDRVILEKFSVREYSSSSPSSLAVIVSPPIGNWVHGVHAGGGVGPCLAVLMPFHTGAAIQGDTLLDIPVEVHSTGGDIGHRYAQFVRRGDPGLYEIDPTAPFAHRLPGAVRKEGHLVVTETEMLEAMVDHEKHDHIFDLSQGIGFTFVPLSQKRSIDRGPVRLTLSLVLTVIPPPGHLFDPSEEEEEE